MKSKHSLLTSLLAVICFGAFGNELTQFPWTSYAFHEPSQTAGYFHQDSVQFHQGENKLKTVRFGLKGGINFSNMNFNKGYSGVNVPLEPAWKAGFAFGLVMQVHLSGRLYLIQEYLFSRTRGQYTPLEANYTFDYISTPVLLHYQVSPKFRIAAGPQLELLLQGKEEISGKSTKVTQMTEERSIGATMGLTYLHSEQISLSARFMHGYNHVGIYQRVGRREFKYELVQVSTNILF